MDSSEYKCAGQDTVLILSSAQANAQHAAGAQTYWLNYEIQLPPLHFFSFFFLSFFKNMICLSQHLILALMKSLPDFLLERCYVPFYYKVLRRKKITLCFKIKEAIL